MRVEKVLVSRSGRFFYVRDLSGDYHSQLGFVRNEDLRKAGDGDVVRTSTGKELFVLTPSFCDSYRKIRRGPQIIPLKDLAAVVSVTGINRESRVVEAGSGSGASACFLGKLVKEVYSYEVREDF
ncbi:hypothetical protein HYY72_04690, partial [Candidatus Woesearchaeota archaeon]|nr:hypothetical protein [Candidatus Woesearchaeota archaeon]